MPFKQNISLSVFLFFALLFFPPVHAQNSAVAWIDAHACPLFPDVVAATEDLSFLSSVLKDKTLVGLGEASHGTQEFYLQKRRIVQYLVRNENFKVLAFESTPTYIQPINDYILTGSGTIKDLLKPMGLYNCDEMLQLFEWLKSFNASKLPKDQVRLLAFDDEAYWQDPLSRDAFMAEQFMKQHQTDSVKSILWSHNLHLAKDTTMTQYKAMGYHLKKAYNDRFYVIFFDTYKGSANVLSNGVMESHSFQGQDAAFSAILKHARFDSFFIAFPKDFHPFTDTSFLITTLYSNWQGVPQPLPALPGSDFDGLIFIKETTASEPVH